MRLVTTNDSTRARTCGRIAGICFAVVAFLLPALLPGASEGKAPAARAKSAGETQALDLDGRPVDPLAATNAAATVLIFVGCECPISNRYAPELRRLHDKFSPRGVRFWMVYPDAD